MKVTVNRPEQNTVVFDNLCIGAFFFNPSGERLSVKINNTDAFVFPNGNEAYGWVWTPLPNSTYLAIRQCTVELTASVSTDKITSLQTDTTE